MGNQSQLHVLSVGDVDGLGSEGGLVCKAEMCAFLCHCAAGCHRHKRCSLEVLPVHIHQSLRHCAAAALGPRRLSAFHTLSPPLLNAHLGLPSLSTMIRLGPDRCAVLV